MAARGLVRRLRCFWRWPLGHAHELVGYVDPVSGRWAARARCIACGHESSLVVGNRRSGVHHANNPLADMLASQGTPRGAPADGKAHALPPGAASAFVVTPPDGGKIAVRCVRVRFDLGLRRTVYCAWPLAGEGATVIAPEFRAAVARAAGLSPAHPWVERLDRELGAELLPVA